MNAEYHLKENQKRLAALEAQQAAETQAKADALQARQDAERHALETRRNERLTQEAYQGLTDEQRAQFHEQIDPVAVANRHAAQALEEYRRLFAQQNEQQRQAELQQTRRDISFNERYTAKQKVDEAAKQRQAEFEKRLETLALQAERYEDPLHRIINALPREAQQIMNEQLSARPSTLDVIQQVQGNAAQQGSAARQDTLQKAYAAELAAVRGNPSAVRLLRARYRQQGLNI